MWAITLSALLHGAAAVTLWVVSLWGFGGLELPRREYAVEIVGISPDPNAMPAEEPPPAEPEKPKHEAHHDKGDVTRKPSPPKQKARPAAAVKDPPPPAKDKDDAPVVATGTPPAKPDDAPPVPATPAAEDKPAIPWPLDDPEVAAASAVDLPGAAPGDAALLIAFRLDRLRDGPWAESIERILAPMPDYETIIAGSATPVSQLFDLLFIATPDVTDVTATFLAAHHHRDEAELEQTLAGTGTRARVAWAPASGGMVGKRARGGGVLHEDPRVFLIPEPGWIMLARPEHLPGMLDPPPVAADAGVGTGAGVDAASAAVAAKPERPRWMQRLVTLVGDPGADAPRSGPVAIVAIANLGRRLIVPGVGAMPAPAATVVSVFVEADGFRVVGVLDFASEHAAEEFAAAASKTRDAALGSIITRHFIAKASAEHAVAGLTFMVRGRQVAAFTRVSAADARGMLAAAAQWSADWFNRQRSEGGSH